MRVDPLGLGADEQRVKVGASFSSFGVADEEVVLLANCAGVNGVLDEIVVDLDFAMVEIDLHACPLPKGITEGLPKGTFG